MYLIRRVVQRLKKHYIYKTPSTGKLLSWLLVVRGPLSTALEFGIVGEVPSLPCASCGHLEHLLSGLLGVQIAFRHRTQVHAKFSVTGGGSRSKRSNVDRLV